MRRWQPLINNSETYCQIAQIAGNEKLAGEGSIINAGDTFGVLGDYPPGMGCSLPGDDQPFSDNSRTGDGRDIADERGGIGVEEEFSKDAPAVPGRNK